MAHPPTADVEMGSMAHPPTADVELVPTPRTYTDEEFTRLEARLLAAHGQATEDGALGTVLDAAATDVLFRLTGQHGLQFRGCQREVLEHIIYGARSTFYLRPSVPPPTPPPPRPSLLTSRRDHRPYPLGPGDEPRDLGRGGAQC
jgi:hypothetical protein